MIWVQTGAWDGKPCPNAKRPAATAGGLAQGWTRVLGEGQLERGVVQAEDHADQVRLTGEAGEHGAAGWCLQEEQSYDGYAQVRRPSPPRVGA